MKNKDWQEILHLVGIQKNIALVNLDESNYGSSVYFQNKGFLKGLQTAEQYIISRLGKKEVKEND